MFDKLKNVNIDACSDSELITLRSQTLSAFNLHMQATQELVRRCNNSQLTAQGKKHEHQKIIIANGRNLSEEELSNIREGGFDVILDMTSNSLRYRKDPVKHTNLKESKLEGIGPRRIEILLYLLEHSTRHISIENASMLPGQLDIIEPNTLSKTIGLLRKALGQKGPKGPYILTECVWGQRYRYAYKLNSDWQYLVIKKNEKS